MTHRHRWSITPAVELLETRSLMSTVTVTSLADSGAGSLRSAVGTAASGDTIALGGLNGTITLQSTLDLSGKNLTLLGPGRGQLTINASGIGRAMSSNGGNGISISDLTIVGGGAGTDHGAAFQMDGVDSSSLGSLSMARVDIRGGVASLDGGAIYTTDANLVLDHCNIFDNRISSAGNTAHGGGIYFDTGTLRITSSSIYDNTAVSGDTGAYVLGGGIFATNTSNCFLTNCTVTGNVAQKTAWASNMPTPAAGAGMWLNGSAQILASTFAYNRVLAPAGSTASNAGGGLFLINTSTTYVQNTIVAANTAPASTDVFSTGSSVLAGYDVIGDGTGSGATNGQYGSQVGTTASPLDAKIGQLADNGGGVKTVALLTGSPAIDAAYNNGPATDARGVTRDGTPDVGAYEYVAPPAPTTPTFAVFPKARVDATGTTASLSGDAVPGGSSTLTYRWKLLSKPAHAGTPVLADGTAADTSAAVSHTGTYQYRLIATSSDGQVISRKVTMQVDSVARGLHIVQHKQTFSGATPTTMRAYVYDQFGVRLAAQPAFDWSMDTGAGAIDADTGVYTPPGPNVYSHLLFRATAGDLTGVAGNRLLALV